MSRLLMAAGVILGAASTLLAGTVLVDARSDIFEAGLGTAGSAVGSNLGLFPVLGVSFTAGAGQTISFNSVTGTVRYASNSADVPPDGDGTAATNITSNTGISGIAFSRSFFLVGVFLSNNAPTPGTQPSSLTFFTSGGGYDADGRVNWFDPSTTFALGQTFYIGDGKTGANNSGGTRQVWNVPPTATRLFLGFADAPGFTGAFGSYDDNLNSLTVDIDTSGLVAGVPEPSAIVLTGLGLLGLAALRRKIA